MEDKISDTTFVKDKTILKKNEEDSQWKWQYIYVCIYTNTHTHHHLYGRYLILGRIDA